MMTRQSYLETHQVAPLPVRPTTDMLLAEVKPLEGKIKGPIDSFIPRNEFELKEIALATGRIEPGAFRDCDIFSSGEEAETQKKLRREMKRATEVFKILKARDGLCDISTRLHLIGLEQETLKLVLIEAARNYAREEANKGGLRLPHKTLYKEVIQRCQSELYPSVDPDILNYALLLAKQEVLAQHPETMTTMSKKYSFFEADLPEANEIIRPETIDLWNDYLHETFDPIFAKVYQTLDSELRNDNLDQATCLFMKEIGLKVSKDNQISKENGVWRVIRRNDIDGFRIDSAQLVVICGMRKREITKTTFEKLVCHEIIIYVMRAQKGYESGYRALQTGMPGSQETEEGLGLLIEKLWSHQPFNQFDRDHIRYLTTAYAAGALDDEPHSETETFDFACDFIASTSKRTGDFASLRVDARKIAYEHVKRAFRGMSDDLRMLSNLSYLSGQLKIAKMIDQADTPPSQLLAYLQCGKFNPLDEEQVKVINEL